MYPRSMDAPQWEQDVEKYIQMGLLEPALELLNEVIEKNPDDVRAKIFKAYVLREMEKDDEALRIVDELLKKEEDEELLLLKGMILYDNEDYKNAAKYFRRVAEINPENIDALYNLASCYDAQEQYDISEKYYRKILKINPSDAEAWNNLAVCLIFQGKHEDALKAAEKALSIEEDYDNAWYNKALALYYMERYKDSVAAFKKCVELSDDSDAWYAMGMAYAQMGQKEEAIRCLREALKRNPEDEDAKSALEQLENA